MLFTAMGLSAKAQDTGYIKSLAARLASDSFFGRGYANDGMAKAARFIADQMDSVGLRPAYGKGFFQNFSYPVNVFDGQMQLRLNGKVLQPGIDFLISPESRPAKAKGHMEQVDSVTWVDREHLVAIKLVDKLTWSVAKEQLGYTLFQIEGYSLPPTFDYDCLAEAKWQKRFDANNVIGLVRGTQYHDSTIVVCAHYDHLGTMGELTVFNGANDNASGVAVMMGLAAAISQRPLKYSVLFIAFAGEEAGMEGSKFYTEKPILPLSKTKFVLNLDLLGNGEEGITVVNAAANTSQFELLKNLNEKGSYLSYIGERGQAANSDHYWFAEKGIPAFFIYTMGPRKAYHDVADKNETLPWPEVADLPSLLLDFLRQL